MPSLSGQEHRGLLGLRYPMEHGVVRDWNDMERVWQYVYSKDQLQTFSEEVRQPKSLRAGSHISCTVRPSHLFTVCLWAQWSGAAKQNLPESWFFAGISAGR